jgi:hypothetical protein
MSQMSYKDKILATRQKLSELLVKSKQNMASLITPTEKKNETRLFIFYIS